VLVQKGLVVMTEGGSVEALMEEVKVACLAMRDAAMSGKRPPEAVDSCVCLLQELGRSYHLITENS
jgi:hypothetical protein